MQASPGDLSRILPDAAHPSWRPAAAGPEAALHCADGWQLFHALLAE